MITETAVATAPEAAAPAVESAPAITPTKEQPATPPTSARESSQTPTTLSPQATTDPAAPPIPPSSAEKPKAEVPEQIFELEIEGEKKTFKANELVDYTQEKIEAAINIHDRYVEGMKSFAESPLETALDAMAAMRFNGDKRAAYQELVKLCDQVLSEEQKYRALPEDRRKALEYEQEANAARAALRQREERDQADAERLQRTQRANALLAAMGSAIKEVGLDDSQPIRERIVSHMKEDQRSGLAPDAKRAALKVKEYLDSFDRSREEAILKRLDIETLKKSRPEIAKALQEAALEETRKARDEAEKKARGEPAPREKQAVGRILPAAHFTSADW